MQETVQLKRECQAVLIPQGTGIVLPADSEVVITQALGGSYTVISNGVMARIAEKDADALGKEKAEKTPGKGGAVEGPADEEAIWQSMRSCYDPEIPVNIVDLGLIYDCVVDNRPDHTGSDVHVKMTLTAPGCGMGAAIAQDVETKIQDVPGVANVNVELVWDPPWNQSMMTEAAKLQLGLL